jgi:hypothetical protein
MEKQSTMGGMEKLVKPIKWAGWNWEVKAKGEIQTMMHRRVNQSIRSVRREPASQK